MVVDNRCPTCDYDLRAHTEGEQCPECGSVIPAGTETTRGRLVRSGAIAAVGLMAASLLLGLALRIVVGDAGRYVELSLPVAALLGPSTFLILSGSLVLWFVHTLVSAVLVFFGWITHARAVEVILWSLALLWWLFCGMAYWGIPV